MLGWLVRRFVAGTVTLVLGMLIIFTVLIEGPTGPRICRLHECHYPCTKVERWAANRFYFDKCWPLNYLDWWFDPSAVQSGTWPSCDNSAANQYREQLHPAGVLTGHLGLSDTISVGTPVTEMFGTGWWLLSLSLLLLILLAATTAAIQRRGRPIDLRQSTGATVQVRALSYRGNLGL
jgi:hypothetical protein